MSAAGAVGGPSAPPAGWPEMALFVMGNRSPAACCFPPPGAGALVALQASAAGLLGERDPALFAALAGVDG